jgi:hypothetical protein
LWKTNSLSRGFKYFIRFNGGFHGTPILRPFSFSHLLYGPQPHTQYFPMKSKFEIGLPLGKPTYKSRNFGVHPTSGF